MIKRILVVLLAAAMCAAFAACNTTPKETTADGTSGTSATTETTATTAPAETTDTTASATESTTEDPGTTPDPVAGTPDIEEILVGNYVTLHYNAAACDVEYEVTKGLGSRQAVTLTVSVKDGFRFDGWSRDDAMANGKGAASKETTYKLEVSNAATIYLNTSMELVYHVGAGKIVKNGFTGSDFYSVTLFHNPNTLPDDGYFARDGYTLVAYNTAEDGSGEEISLGAKVRATGAGKIDLWCVWEKNSPESDFEYKKSGNSVTITGYKGSDETVVIPTTLGGGTVRTIAEDAFYEATMKKVVVAKTVGMIAEYAFENCPNLETVVLYDGSIKTTGSWRDAVPGVSDNSFFNCPNLQNLRVNTVYRLTDVWQSMGAGKLDRLMWAEDKKKVIIIGGSGSLYGFDSAVLDDALGGEYEIINLGENANISSWTYFDIAEDFVKEGDIILWCPEPGSYTLGRAEVGQRFWDFRKSDYDFLKYLDISLYSDLYTTFATYTTSLSGTAMRPFDSLSKDINKYGDQISYRMWNGARYKSYNLSYSFGDANVLSELVSRITDKGASVYFSFAAMQQSGIAGTNEKDILNFEKMITSIPGIVSISDYRDLVFQDDYFYDSEWHMTIAGAHARSVQVARDLLAQLASEGK